MADRTTILKAPGVLDAQGKPTPRYDVVVAGRMARLTPEAWQAERDRMVAICAGCHARGFAADQLARADRVIRESDRVAAEAIDIVEGLYRDQVLPAPKERPASPDLLRFYEVTDPIEETLYFMFLEHRMRSFQGAFHLNPDYQHWYGWADLRLPDHV